MLRTIPLSTWKYVYAVISYRFYHYKPFLTTFNVNTSNEMLYFWVNSKNGCLHTALSTIQVLCKWSFALFSILRFPCDLSAHQFSASAVGILSFLLCMDSKHEFFPIKHKKTTSWRQAIPKKKTVFSLFVVLLPNVA